MRLAVAELAQAFCSDSLFLKVSLCLYGLAQIECIENRGGFKGGVKIRGVRVNPLSFAPLCFIIKGVQGTTLSLSYLPSFFSNSGFNTTYTNYTFLKILN